MDSETLARKLLNTPHLSGGYNTEVERFTRILDTALAEREAQAVQREREAARVFIHHIHSCVLQAMGRRDNFAILNDLSNELATYNDNRKG